MGLPINHSDSVISYDIDECQTSDQVNPFLANTSAPSTVYAIGPQVSDHITFLNFKDKDFALLKPAIETCRVVKSPYEIALIKHANEVSTAAHVAVMKAVKSAANE